MSWNHNVHYHDVVIRAIPPQCHRALDVGCGQGALAQKVALSCGKVVAIDADSNCIEFARNASGARTNIEFIQGDVLLASMEESSFDFVSAVASLHHLPLQPALERFRALLRPGGVLAVIGLYRSSTVADYAIAAVALPTSWTMRIINGTGDVGAPIREPAESLTKIRSSFDEVMPGGIFRRHFFFRYSFVWRKPTDPSKSPAQR